MLRIKNYTNFLFESHLVVDPDFSNIIRSIAKKNAVAGNLFRFFNKQMNTNVNYLSTGKKNDEVSFTNDKQVDRIIQSGDDPFSKGRGSSKIGRVVRQILLANKIETSDKEIEEFVNLYKLEWDGVNSPGNFEIVSGDKIIYWYNCKRYVSGGGTLNGSCMRYDKCSDFFDIYVKNPEQCKLVILKTPDGELLLGRALLWTCEDGSIYLDRIYTVNDYDENKIINWTKGQFSDDKFTCYKLNPNIEHITVRPNNIEHKKYPFMDSLNAINISKGVLKYNVDNKEDLFYIARNTDGTKEIQNYVYSKTHNEFIKPAESVLIQQIHDYVYKSECVEDIRGLMVYKPRAVFCPAYKGYCDQSQVLETKKWGKVPNYEMVTVLVNPETGEHEEMPKIAFGDRYVSAFDENIRIKYVPKEISFKDVLGNWYLKTAIDKFTSSKTNVNYSILEVKEVKKDQLEKIGAPTTAFMVVLDRTKVLTCQAWALKGTDLAVGVEYLQEDIAGKIFCEVKLADILKLEEASSGFFKKPTTKYLRTRNLYWDIYDKNPIVDISPKIESKNFDTTHTLGAISEFKRIDTFMSNNSNQYNLSKGNYIIRNITFEERTRIYNKLVTKKWLESKKFQRWILKFEETLTSDKNTNALNLMTGYFNRMRPFGINRRYSSPEFIAWFNNNIEKMLCGLYFWTTTYDRSSAAHMTGSLYGDASTNTSNWLTQYTYSENSGTFGDDMYFIGEEIDYTDGDGYNGHLSRWMRNHFLLNFTDHDEYTTYNNAIAGWTSFKEENLPEILSKIV